MLHRCIRSLADELLGFAVRHPGGNSLFVVPSISRAQEVLGQKIGCGGRVLVQVCDRPAHTVTVIKVGSKSDCEHVRGLAVDRALVWQDGDYKDYRDYLIRDCVEPALAASGGQVTVLLIDPENGWDGAAASSFKSSQYIVADDGLDKVAEPKAQGIDARI